MGISLKEYVRGMLIKYKDYPEMRGILKELYEEWYDQPKQPKTTVPQGSYCILDQTCSS